MSIVTTTITTLYKEIDNDIIECHRCKNKFSIKSDFIYYAYDGASFITCMNCKTQYRIIFTHLAVNLIYEETL